MGNRTKRVGRVAVLVTALTLVVMGETLNVASVEGKSMEPSLADGSIVFYSRCVVNIRRGDIVVFRQKFAKEETYFVKRVVGISGDEISSRHGQLFVNGKVSSEKCVGRTDCEDCKVPKGKVFVLGDNREDSIDSRQFGCISMKSVEGKVLARAGSRG